MEVHGNFGGWDYTVVMGNLHTLYCMCVITSGRTRGVAAEENAVGDLGSSSCSRHNRGAASSCGHNQGTGVEMDAVGEQQLKQTQSGHSSVQPRKTSARQRHYCIKLHQTDVHRYRGSW